MSGRRIPIRQNGKVVGYINPPLRFRFKRAVMRLLNLLTGRRRKLRK